MPVKTKKQQRRYLLPALLVASILILGVQVALDISFWRSNHFSTEPITSLIVQAVHGINRPAVIDPASKQVYLPNANLVLPAQPENLPNLEYSYSPALSGSDAQVNITLTNAVNVGISKLLNAESAAQQHRDLNRLFAAVPDLQACSRGIDVVFGTKIKYDHLQFSKQLADGRGMYVYTEQHSCSYNLQPLVEYLRGAQSY